MNYWKQFAEILSLELEQEFVLTDVDGNTIGQPKEQNIRIVLDDLKFMNFPNFNTNTGMYKGMEADKLYSLEELGI